MIVRKSAVFPADRDTVFQKLQRLETLQYIAKPYADFEPVGDTPVVFASGSTCVCSLRLFGCIPFGLHTIRIERFDREGISSREGNRHVPVWNHTIRLEAVDEDHTQYTDIVEIRAGVRTVFIWLWAKAFYAHRQRKWIHLLQDAMDDKQKSRLYFNRHSSTGINRNGYWRVDYRITSEILMGENVKRLVDVGCGNGAFLARFASLVPAAKLTGLDLSHEMVLRSRERLPDADIVEGDAESMPFPDGVFDAVTCHMSIHHHPHPERSLREMHRILAKDGIAVIDELTGPAWARKALNRAFQKWPTGDHAVYSRREMEQMLEDAGFKDIESRLITPFSYVCTGRKR